MKPGKFIVVEGIDGTGKTTLIQKLRARLQELPFPVVAVRDPGNTQISSAIRSLLLDPANGSIAPMTELLLYCASRAQLLQEVIAPALARGETVISDRFYFSTFAYQGAHNLMPLPELQTLVRGAAGNLEPDMVILLDAPAAVCLGRINREHDRVESRGAAYMEAVRQIYLQTVNALSPSRRAVINAAGTPEEVAAEGIRALETMLAAQGC